MYIVQYKIHQKWKKNIKKSNLFKNLQNMPWLDEKVKTQGSILWCHSKKWYTVSDCNKQKLMHVDAFLLLE